MNRSVPWPQPVLDVIRTLEREGFEAYLVGGCVRDTLLSRSVNDFDIATNATPAQVMERFTRTVPTGLKHGTVTVLQNGLPLEVTTYRRDVGYSDGRRPDAVEFCDTIEEDLSRRDFTVNAMAMDVHGQVIDPFMGQRDLASRVIRTVGNADARLKEDGLRILRAVRFAAQLDFTISEDTWDAMQRQADGLESVSAERIGIEIAKIAASHWDSVVHELVNSRIWEHVSSVLRPLRSGFAVLSTIAAEMRSAISGESEERIVDSFALWCKAAQVDPESCLKMGRALRWPGRRCRSTGTLLQLLHRDPLTWDSFTWRENLFSKGKQTVLRACHLLDAWHSSHGVNTGRAESGERLERCRQYISSQPIWNDAELAITGTDILGLGASGPLVGAVKRHLIREVLMLRADNDEATLLTMAKRFIRGIEKGEAVEHE